LLETYFHRKGGGWQIRADIRAAVEFLPINLVGVWPALPPMDLILMRNVLIYFDVPTRQRILQRLRTVLQPDGFLVLGGAETTHNLDDGFVAVPFDNVSFFRLRGQPEVGGRSGPGRV
jgi:chemotaxis protein methyltransferase CheR